MSAPPLEVAAVQVVAHAAGGVHRIEQTGVAPQAPSVDFFAYTLYPARFHKLTAVQLKPTVVSFLFEEPSAGLNAKPVTFGTELLEHGSQFSIIVCTRSKVPKVSTDMVSLNEAPLIVVAVSDAAEVAVGTVPVNVPVSPVSVTVILS